MWRRKKFLLVGLLAAVVVIGSISGIVLAQTENGGDTQPKAQYGALLDKVCAIYEQNTGTAINSQELQKAFDQARSEMRSEAMDKYLQSLVDQGKINQEQADQYKAWLQAKPDVPAGFGFKGHGRFHGMGGMRGFGGPCVPPE